MIIDFVGKFYDNHSLSIINRNLVIQLTTIHPDWEISITSLDSYDPEYKLDKDIVKQLKRFTDREIKVRHKYIGNTDWGNKVRKPLIEDLKTKTPLLL